MKLASLFLLTGLTGLTGLALLAAACDSNRTAPAGNAVPGAAAGSASSTVAATPHAGSAGIARIYWEQAPGGLADASTAIRSAVAKANADGRTLVVYVGATWCEPCQRFHHAVENGELDAAFPRLSFLAFDADRDGEPLAAAGYFSRLIPLFALPKSDGHASGKQIEGSVKGDSAVGEITPRLRGLISGS